RMVRGEPVLVSPVTPNYSSLIWEDDAVALGIKAMELGRVPPLVVNLGGDEPVTTEEYCAYAGELLGIEPRFEVTEATYAGSFMAPTKRPEVLGACTVDWREGMRRLIAKQSPDGVTAEA